MSSAMPSKLLKLKVLADVPRTEYVDPSKQSRSLDKGSRLDFVRMLRKSAKAEAPTPKRAPKVKKTFNAAVWLRFLTPPEQPVSLWIMYRDDRGEFAVMVDEAKLSTSTSTMLSGCVTLEVQGEITYMKACCGGTRDGETFAVEELYVQRHASEQAATNQRSA
ncbi:MULTISPECIES: hypothetical protein [unclassified Hahella]|uniref:hypothetical protein n=1 Tax=unclassified Hahella TaxID=2624107 RepID=UPI0020A636DB|nr:MULTISPECIES: hypothetical protein [unclassified Hahella]MDG9668440.1 hypothetical protein [Hahella sp. CR1]